MNTQTHTELWNHNNHYHNYLLSQVPPRCHNALDIGCGDGHFAARLAAYCATVVGIDSDGNAIDHAREEYGSLRNVSFECMKFQDRLLPENHYDFISLIAVLHHMELARTVQRIKKILAPGGVVAIIGLFREATVADLLLSGVAIPVNLIFKLAKGCFGNDGDKEMVIAEPKEPLCMIKQKLNEILPNCKYKRHLFWRYSVVWQKPRL